MMIFASVILAAVALGVNSEECYLCHAGDGENVLTLVSVFGPNGAEDGLQDAIKYKHENCGTGVTEGLKMQQCEKGCVIAKHENSAAVIAGCARRGMSARGVATFTDGNQKYQMGVCSKRGCNRSFGNALSNIEEPTTTTTTTAAPPVEEKKEEKKEEEKKAEEKKEEEKKTENETPKAEEPKPSSATAAALSFGTTILLIVSLL